LTWATTNELNNKGYDVERSLNGRDFSSIAFVKTNGRDVANVNNYTYIDQEKLNAEALYYRLKQIDLNGAFKYSGIIKVNIQNRFSFSVYPNPVANNSWAQFQLTENAKVTIQLVSANGKIIQAVNKGMLSRGTYSIPLNLENAAKGIYYVKLFLDKEPYSLAIIK
jgi:hypothetical protein